LPKGDDYCQALRQTLMPWMPKILGHQVLKIGGLSGEVMTNLPMHHQIILSEKITPNLAALCNAKVSLVQASLTELPFIQKEIQAVREASLLRGKTLHFWSPLFYIKAIFIAFNWRDSYIEAMYAHGFDETIKRSCYRQLETPKSASLTCFLIFLLINLTLLIPR